MRKVESHVGFGVRDFVAVSWAEMRAAGSDIAREFQQEACRSLLIAISSAMIDGQIVEIFPSSSG